MSIELPRYLESKSRTRVLVAVAAATATCGVIHAKASESEASRERSNTRSRLRALKHAKQVASAQMTSASAEALAHITEETHDLPLFDRR